MPVPNLLHPIECQIEAASKSTTPQDSTLREPIRSVRSETVTINAQISHSAGNLRSLPQGVAETATGYILLRKVDVDAASYSPQEGDRIIAMGHQTVSLFIIHIQPIGHYTVTDGWTMLRAYFTDRRPSARIASV